MVYTELWQGDCFDVMPNIPNHPVNLILCDLPYGRTRNEWDRPLDLDRLWQEYLRILAPNGCIALYADENVPYKEIVRILDIANENKMKLVIATKSLEK